MQKNGMVIFQTEDKDVVLDVAVQDETVWLSQAQMVELFQRDVSVISRHIKNVFHEKEVDEKSNLHFLQIANSDRPVAYYSLDVIISVGYRVKSKRGLEFRRWANRVLKDYIIKGYAVNHNCIDRPAVRKPDIFTGKTEQAVCHIQRGLPAPPLSLCLNCYGVRSVTGIKFYMALDKEEVIF